MEGNTKYVWLLAMCVILMHNLNDAEVMRGKKLIEKICKDTPNVSLCLDVLTAGQGSANATLSELAMISLKAAAENASDILFDVKSMIDNPDLEPEIQQGLADCKETLLDAQGQLEDTIASILAHSKRDALIWLRAALAAIDTCDASIPGDDDILSRRSIGFRQLCKITVSISKAMINGP
ncbi:hypothetical protein VNO77_13988 [Canavalia gladiata]|uniref:Pectinesterase inhibitor domain-containing protein n=1 Tax=Canavalia gladiata TaxID=3824 RepID=A0AAN9QV88_CANGL